MGAMSAFNRLFTDHPASVDETYGQHFVAAAGFGFRMIWGGIVCLVHALVPGAFCTKGSDTDLRAARAHGHEPPPPGGIARAADGDA